MRWSSQREVLSGIHHEPRVSEETGNEREQSERMSMFEIQEVDSKSSLESYNM
jgi:hypothetical protein